VGLLVQFIFAITQVGFFHPDQHFQLIEFSSWQLGEPSGAASVWELKSQIRPTLQVYLFSGFVKTCHFFSIYDAYTQLTLLRIVFSILALLVFNLIGIYYFSSNKKLLYLVLVLINFSWSLPYIRTLYSSEIACSIAFFGAILLYEQKKKQWFYVFLTGILFSISFYCRFQIGFSLIGFGLWYLFIDRNYKSILPMLAGFGLGMGFNLFLDYQFYHQFVFTPYEYFRVNIVEGKAAEFGTSSFIWYILILTLVIGTPPLSFFLFYSFLKGIVKQYQQPIVISVVFFIVGHCLVAHKEERFMFPVLNVLPLIAGWGLAGTSNSFPFFSKTNQYASRFVVGSSVSLTVLLLALFVILNPYYQAIEFTRKLVAKFEKTPTTIYCLRRTPFETENHLPLTFYRKSASTIRLVTVTNVDSLKYIKNAWIATTYNDAKADFPRLDSLGVEPSLFSSETLWNTNRFLQKKDINTINEIWVLYRIK
jgi:phosphatidylinositol glycan class B